MLNVSPGVKALSTPREGMRINTATVRFLKERIIPVYQLHAVIFEDETVLEDTVENGMILFVTNQTVEMPVQVELYDGVSKLVGSHRALPKQVYLSLQMKRNVAQVPLYPFEVDA